jgi:hypothetical protein
MQGKICLDRRIMKTVRLGTIVADGGTKAGKLGKMSGRMLKMAAARGR